MLQHTPVAPPPGRGRLVHHATNRFQAHAWKAYLILGVLATNTYFLLPGIAAQDIFFALLSFATALTIFAGIYLNRPITKLEWYLMGAGVFLWALGDGIWAYDEIVLLIEAPFPSIADAVYLCGYLVYLGGLSVLVRRRMHSQDWNNLIDATIIAGGVGVVSGVYLMMPYATDAALPLLDRIVSIAYPFMDVLMLAVLARLLLSSPRSSLAALFLGAGLIFWLGGDTVFSIMSLHGTYATGVWSDGLWLLGYTLLGVAALHPSMRALAGADEAHMRHAPQRRLALLAGTALLPPLTMAVQAASGETTNVGLIIGGTVVLFMLALVRMNGLISRLEHAFVREQTLRRITAQLAAAADQAAIYRSLLRGARRLIAPSGGARVVLIVEPHTLLHRNHRDTRRAANIFVQLERIPVEVRAQLVEQRAALTLETDRHQWLHEVGFGHAAQVLLVPLFCRQALIGVFVASSSPRLAAKLGQALELLAAQATLALERIVLAEDVLRRQADARLAALVQNASDMIFVFDVHGNIQYVSPSVMRTLGYAPHELLGTSCRALVHPEDVAATDQYFTLAHPIDGAPLHELRMRHQHGHWVYLEAGAINLVHDPLVQGVIFTGRDIRERKTFEAQLAHQAFHDALTGLPNRVLFMDRLQHALDRTHRAQGRIALLFLDLDRFKTVNDSLGHEAGDQLLIAVARRLSGCVRPNDTVARFGGDEFTILLADVVDPAAVLHVADRIIAAIERPMLVSDHQIVTSTSIGIVLSEPQDVLPADLLRYADVAMYQAKHAGKGRYTVFDRHMNTLIVEQLSLEQDLRRAIELHELRVQYQPIIDLATGRMTGLEALVRWQHPERGIVPPAQFIPLAEETGLILPIGRWVLEEACRQARCWQAQTTDQAPLEISVNLSARQFRQPHLVHEITEILRRTGLPARALKLEITESVIMEDAEATVTKLHELSALGVRLVIDDFGTGYSSLSYLKRFVVDTLKIDRAFIKDAGRNPEDTAIVRAVTTLAHSLGLSVTAEGVETSDVCAYLSALGCEQAQGYYFAEPLNSADVERLLSASAPGLQPVQV